MHVQAYPELCSEAVEYVIAAPPAISSAGAGASAPHVVLAVDASLDREAADGAAAALTELLPTLAPGTKISLITFDGAVAVHHLGAGPRRSHVLPGSRPLEQSEVQALLDSSGA